MPRFSASYLEKMGRAWQNVYEIANGKTAPKVVWDAGWFIIDGRRHRRKDLEKMTAELRRRNAAPVFEAAGLSVPNGARGTPQGDM